MSPPAIPLRTTRTLAHVLLEIADVGPIIWSPDTRDVDDDAMGEALDRLDALQLEAREMIERATGVTWAQIERACL